MATIEVLGTSCGKCDRLLHNVHEAVKELGTGDKVEKIRDISRMLDLSPSALPALAIDGKVVSSGVVLKTQEIKRLIETRSEKETQ